MQEIEIGPYYQVYKQESILENETHKVLWDFEIQTDHVIPPRRLDLKIINKKRKKNRQIAIVTADHRVKIKES